MEIVKVFTKYDQPFRVIHVPIFEPLQARKLIDCTCISPISMHSLILKPIHEKKGLCGVKFITYGEKS